jgi:hypothetical protein
MREINNLSTFNEQLRLREHTRASKKTVSRKRALFVGVKKDRLLPPSPLFFDDHEKIRFSFLRGPRRTHASENSHTGTAQHSTAQHSSSTAQALRAPAADARTVQSINAAVEISLSRVSPSWVQSFGGLGKILLDIRRRGDVARRAYQKGKES